jgi:hypothetical protein
MSLKFCFSRIISRGQKVCIIGFSLNLQAFSFILPLLMEAFPFLFSHPLKPLGPCFKDAYEDFLSDFVENVGGRAFKALLIRDVIFGEFSLNVTKG